MPRVLRRPLMAAAALVAIIAVAVAVGALILTDRAGSSRPRAASPVTRAPTPPSASRGHGLDTPFVVSGTRFAVFAGVSQPWTRQVRGTRLAPGQRIEFVTVLARRLVAPAVDLEALHFTVVGGVRPVNPLPDVGTGSRAFGAPLTRSVNQLVVNHLAFAVTGPRVSLRLQFTPTNAAGPTIAVPLSG